MECKECSSWLCKSTAGDGMGISPLLNGVLAVRLFSLSVLQENNGRKQPAFCAVVVSVWATVRLERRRGFEIRTRDLMFGANSSGPFLCSFDLILFFFCPFTMELLFKCGEKSSSMRTPPPLPPSGISMWQKSAKPQCFPWQKPASLRSVIMFDRRSHDWSVFSRLSQQTQECLIGGEPDECQPPAAWLRTRVISVNAAVSCRICLIESGILWRSALCPQGDPGPKENNLWRHRRQTSTWKQTQLHRSQLPKWAIRGGWTPLQKGSDGLIHHF